jgi:acyl-CoA thioester hydrolase
VNDQPADEKLSPAHYRFWVEEQVRYRDLDALGHCNSAVYSTYFEQVRVTLLRSVGLPLVSDADPFALVRQLIEYRAELMLGAKLRIGTRITRLGRTSIAFDNAIFAGERCAATAEIVGVLISVNDRRPMELSPDLRERLSAYV